jgi:hypothetical protein
MAHAASITGMSHGRVSIGYGLSSFGKGLGLVAAANQPAFDH